MKFTVADVMTQRVVTVTPETSFKEAVRLLRRRRVSGMPVVDPAGALVGIVSETDLLNKAEKRAPDSYVLESPHQQLDRARAAGLNVADVMTREVVTIRADHPVALAARELHGHGFKRFPVVDEKGKLVGIVTRSDLLKVFLRTDRDIERDVRETVRNRGITASVSRGVVTLEGSVEAKGRTEALVRTVAAIDGVVGVNSMITSAVDDPR